MNKMIIIGAAAAVLLAVGGGAAFFLLSGSDEEVIEGEVAAGEAEEEAVVEQDPPIYHGLDPDFVYAFQDPKTVRFVKASIEVMVRDEDVIESLKLHMPAIRDGVIMLFNQQSEADLLTVEGKEAFRGKVLAQIRGTLEELTGSPGVEAVYFSNFVMQ